MPTTGTVWPNKKRAKEEAAKLAVDWVELEENLGARVAKAREIEKREKEEREKAIKAGKAAPGEDGINWVGQLVGTYSSFLPSIIFLQETDPSITTSRMGPTTQSHRNLHHLRPSSPASAT